MRKILALHILFLLSISSVFSQNLIGRVFDGTEPMPYVSVYLKEDPEKGKTGRGFREQG